MKNIIVLVSAIALSAYSSASDEVEVCTQMSELAGAVMRARQVGLPAADLAKHFKDNYEESDNSLYKLSIVMITDAFEVPRYSTQSYRDDSINDFKNEYFIECISQ